MWVWGWNVISKTAIVKAKKLLPKVNFDPGDLLDHKEFISRYSTDVIVFSEITWCVLDKLTAFKKLMSANTKGCGFFHSLVFHKEGTQKYGLDYFTSLHELIEYWQDTIDIKDFGKFNEILGASLENNGYCTDNYRTFFYGVIK